MSGPSRLPEILECLLFPDHMVFLLVGSYTKFGSSLTVSCSPLSVCLSELIDFWFIFCHISRFRNAPPGHFQILVSLKEGLRTGYDSRISYRLYIGMHVQCDKVIFCLIFIWYSWFVLGWFLIFWTFPSNLQIQRSMLIQQEIVEAHIRIQSCNALFLQEGAISTFVHNSYYSLLLNKLYFSWNSWTS